MPDPQKIEEVVQRLKIELEDAKRFHEYVCADPDDLRLLLTAYAERGKALRASALALDSADHFAKEMLETFQDNYLIEGKRHPDVDPEELADIDQVESLISDIEAARRAAGLAGGRDSG